MGVNARLALNILLVMCIVAAAAGGLALLFMDSGSTGGVTITLDETAPENTLAAETTAAQTTIKVYVSGEARRPGVYELPANSRADDALKAAGGPTSDAALDLINLAKKLSDEEHIHIPDGSNGTAAGGSVSADNRQSAPANGTANISSSGKLNINTATVEELISLPNIGPSRAAAIADYREREGPFSSVDELKSVSGLGEKITDSIREFVEVR